MSGKRIKLKKISTSVVQPVKKAKAMSPQKVKSAKSLKIRPSTPKKKKKGRTTYRKSGPSKMTEIDAKAVTDEVGREGAKKFTTEELRKLLRKVK